MKILVVGSGGREHALAWKLSQSPRAERIFCAPGNAGTEQLGENVPIAANDLAGLVRFARDNQIDLTVVGPDDPLAAGVVDLFQGASLRVFGPNKSAARLESSKIFAKEMMRKCHIPTALAGSFSRSDEATSFCERLQFPIVIKADGLALGKGVIIAQHCDEAAIAINQMMNEGKFGEAGRRIVVEEFLRGTECSVHALVSGGTYRMLATARDHKRAFDGDQGPNTGGMGAVSPADNWSADAQDVFDRDVLRPLTSGLMRSGIAFSGLLFPGLMITAEGPRVLEFNCRFGDPETQAIMPRLKTDLLDLIDATIDGTVDDLTIEWDDRPAVTVVLASGGYPGSYEQGKPIAGLAECAQLPDVHVFHAGTRRQNGDVVTAGGRVLAVTALGETVKLARERAYDAVARISFAGCHYRRDIAVPAVPVNVAGH
ncbi:MAG TPA: phosphoribosylamine--glycine ligase [Chthoniobacterales bacterium]|nr:phosphoribosylamine--glycine ligase [Chthoniobacterales bacterium]